MSSLSKMRTTRLSLQTAITMSLLATTFFTNDRASVSAATVVAPGRPAAILVLANDDALIVDAADDFGRVLSVMTGQSIAVTKLNAAPTFSKDNFPIAVGKLAVDLGLKVEKQSRAGDGFRYRMHDGRLLIVGESAQGVVHGVYDLLERLGCGWYAPGTVGEVIPQLNTVMLPDDLDHAAVSDSVQRRFWYGGKNGTGAATSKWLLRNKAEHQVGSWNHAWSGLVTKDLFAEHPDYFSLNKGKRTTKQICTSNPETAKVAAASLLQRMTKDSHLRIHAAGPNDGGNLCECESCAKLDTPGYLEPTSGKPACADRVFGFANQLAAITSREFPDRDLGVLVYSEYSRPPLKFDRLHPNVFPMVAPIRRCRFHGPGNPHCPSALRLDEEIAAWGKFSDKLGFYVYNYNLADTLLPLSKISYFKDLTRSLHRTKVQELAWIFETIDSWSTHAPHLYLSARIAWNSHVDIDAEMERYYRGFYGEAAEPMRRYWQRIDHAYTTTAVHTGSQYGLHRIWTKELLTSCRADIAEAQRLAKTDRVQNAVAMANAGLVCAELFITGIWNNIAECQFVAAEQAQKSLAAQIAEMSKQTEPSWVHDRYAFGYYTRFVGLTVEGGAAALADGGVLVTKLPDVWMFKKDPNLVGMNQQWWKATHDDRDWTSIATFSRSWDDNGLSEYQGEAWYRTSFTMPAKIPDGDLRLWFGGFDYNIEVFLNDQRVGGWLGFAKPAEAVNIGKFLKPGENRITVRVAAGDLGELGTGGLMMPAMIYKWNGKSMMPTNKKGVEYEQ